MARIRWNDEISASYGGPANDGIIDSVTYLDMTYSFRAEGWTGGGSSTYLELGARNITDEYPTPDGQFGAGINLFMHDPRGRTWFARVRHEF